MAHACGEAKLHGDRLDTWKTIVLDGRIPEFGAYLVRGGEAAPKPMIALRMMRMSAWFLIAVGLVVVAWDGSLLRDAMSSTSWPTAEGRVISAEIFSTTTHRVREGRYSRREWLSVSSRPSVRYSYSVRGADYESDRIGFVPAVFDAKALVDELRSAPSVLVHYDPAFPGRSVLRTGAAIEHLIPFVLALLSFAIACSLLWMARKTAPQASAQP